MDILTYLPLSDIQSPWQPLWALELVAKVLLGAWLFFFGASVGSFLNVVIYRLPRGMSLVHPRSRCPTCGHAIRGWDNIPLVSWLLLGGKCRDCRTPISSRYYYVELIVGLTFLLAAAFEGFLPRHFWLPIGDIARRPLGMHDGAAFWCTYATHVVLLTTLIGAALIDSDAFRVPWRLFAPVLVLGFFLPLAWPEMRRFPVDLNLRLPTWQAGLADGIGGLLAGGVLGGITGFWFWIKGRRTWCRFAPVLTFASVGVVMGWQPATFVILFSLIFFFLVLVAQWGWRATVVVPLAAAVFVVTAPLLLGIVSPIPAEVIRHPGRWPLFIAWGAVFLSLGAAMFAGPQYFLSQRLPGVPADKAVGASDEPGAAAAPLPSSAEPPPP